MMIKDYKGFKCEYWERVFPICHELYFDMIDGEIFKNDTNDIVCMNCGSVYRLDGIEFIPRFKKLLVILRNSIGLAMKEVSGNVKV